MQIDVLPDVVSTVICEGALETRQMRCVGAVKNITCLRRYKFSQNFGAFKSRPRDA